MRRKRNKKVLSIWSGANEDSWFNFDKLSKYRKLKNPDTREKCRADFNQFYLLSADVGRIHDSTVVCVFRVNVNNEGRHRVSLVNIYVLGRTPQTKPFAVQALDLKKLIKAFNPREVVIDTNGLGLGLGDEMTRPQYDEFGEYYPAYGFFNDDEYKKTQPKDAICILYSLKASGPLKSKIHGNCYSRISSGMVRFLIREQEAKSALLATKQGQQMSIEKRIQRLMPHEMTTKLFEEMAK